MNKFEEIVEMLQKNASELEEQQQKEFKEKQDTRRVSANVLSHTFKTIIIPEISDLERALKKNGFITEIKTNDPFFELIGEKLFEMAELLVYNKSRRIPHSSFKIVGSVIEGDIKMISTPRMDEPSRTYHFSAASVSQESLQEILVQFVIDSLS
jgi:hypothetical protein